MIPVNINPILKMIKTYKVPNDQKKLIEPTSKKKITEKLSKNKRNLNK